MATFKLPAPPALTGNTEQDVVTQNAYLNDMYSQMRYALSSIDEENLSEGMLNKLGIKEDK